MRLSALVAALLLSLGARLEAQGPGTPPVPGVPEIPREEMQRLMSMAQEMMNPAAAVLAHRAELGLGEAQAAALRRLSDEMGRALQPVMQAGLRPLHVQLMRALADTAVALDEAAVRAEYAAKAAQEADMMIAMVHTIRGVNRVLTPAQREKLEQLQAGPGLELMRLMTGGFGPLTGGAAAGPPKR